MMAYRHYTPSRGLLLGLVALTCLLSLTQAKMDILAYDYYRKFEKELKLGECPNRQVMVNRSGLVDVQEERCLLHKKGEVRNIPRELSDTRNELIASPKAVVAYPSLCSAEAASHLGILQGGDCVAVEIASRLHFSDRIVVRGFRGYLISSMDILHTDDLAQDAMIRDGQGSYYKNKYYVKDRSYGTMELIFVQFRFWNSSQAARARNITLSDPKMSGYMQEIVKQVGQPKGVTVTSLSTASSSKYKVRKEKRWNRAIRYVLILELHIKNRWEKIIREKTAPLFKYTFFPFINNAPTGWRLPDPIAWEQTSVMEIKLRQAVSLLKRLVRKCKGYKERPCRRARQLRTKLKKIRKEIHKGRSTWENLTTEELKDITKRYESQVITNGNVAKGLARDVKKMIRRQNRRQRAKNSTSYISSRDHRIRHRARKNGRRKDKSRRKSAKALSTIGGTGSMGWF